MAIDYGGVSGPDWYGGAARRIGLATATWPAPPILVLHSGAGGLAGAIAAQTPLAGVIFVDAILPHPGASWMATAPAALGEHLRGIAREGLLPPWNRWFGADPAARMIPDGAARARFVADLPRVPLAFLDTPAPLHGPLAAPCAYLRLSDAYVAEADAAAGLGWTVRREAMHHLAMLTDPAKLAAILLDVGMSLETA